jgi:alpha-galactosidase
MKPVWFNLDGARSSLIVEQADSGFPILTHWGPKLAASGPYPSWNATTPVPSFSLDQNQPLRSVPVFGRGWFGPSAMMIDGDGSAWAPDFDDCEVKHTLTSLVSAATSGIHGIGLTQTILLDAESDTLSLSATLANHGDGPVRIAWLASGCLPLPATAKGVESFSGRHNHEFQSVSDTLSRSGWSRENRRGLTSHDCPPMALVLGDGATQHTGPVWAAQLAWSGNHRQTIDWIEDGRWLWMAGTWLAPGEIILQPGDTFSTPEWLATFSEAGRDGAAQNFHAFLRSQSPLRDGGEMPPRPVHVNTWEGFYFNHVEAELMSLADTSAALGVERFVLDDGWFQGRNDDTSSLGDWVHDQTKYPNGLAPLAQHVVDLGMQFGLWVEPEMINRNSDLFRQHPDWIFGLDDQAPLTSRNQLVLDLTLADVSSYLFGRLDALLCELPISYLKWDHNRDLTEAGSGNRPAYFKQVYAAYKLIDRLRAAHPSVEIEACAGGGGRIDAGILKRTHRVWTSDCIDAVSRVDMQKGFLQFFPPEIMGSHVGASPAHSTGRSQSLDFRAAIATMGHFGLEFDTRTLSAEQAEQLRSWISLYKRIRLTTHNGAVWRGESEDGVQWTAMGSADEFVLFLVRLLPASQKFSPTIRLPFVRPDQCYSLRRIDPGPILSGNHAGVPFTQANSAGIEMDGGWISEIGLSLPYMKAETCLVIEGCVR